MWGEATIHLLSACQPGQTSLGKQSLARESWKHHSLSGMIRQITWALWTVALPPYREAGCRLVTKHKYTHTHTSKSLWQQHGIADFSMTFIFGKLLFLCCWCPNAFDLVLPQSPWTTSLLMLLVETSHIVLALISLFFFWRNEGVTAFLGSIFPPFWSFLLVYKQLAHLCRSPFFPPRPPFLSSVSSSHYCNFLPISLYVILASFYKNRGLFISTPIFPSFTVISLQISALSGRVLPSCLDHSALICETAEPLRTVEHASLEWIYVLREAQKAEKKWRNQMWHHHLLLHD